MMPPMHAMGKAQYSHMQVLPCKPGLTLASVAISTARSAVPSRDTALHPSSRDSGQRRTSSRMARASRPTPRGLSRSFSTAATIAAWESCSQAPPQHAYGWAQQPALHYSALQLPLCMLLAALHDRFASKQLASQQRMALQHDGSSCTHMMSAEVHAHTWGIQEGKAHLVQDV